MINYSQEDKLLIKSLLETYPKKVEKNIKNAKRVFGDGAYDRRGLREEAEKNAAVPIILKKCSSVPPKQ